MTERLLSAADYQTRAGVTYSGADLTRLEALLDDASELVAAEARLETAWTAATVPAVILPVVAAATRRALENPAGNASELLGGFQFSAGDLGKAGPYLAEAEKRIVRQAAGRDSISTIRVGRPGLAGNLTDELDEILE